MATILSLILQTMRLPIANVIILSTGFAVATALNVGLDFTPTNQRCGNSLNDACIRDLVVPFVLGLGFRDCTSFFRTTITVSPRTSTVTRTTTISTTVTENFEIRRRAVEAKPKRSIEIPTRIPSYAARCSGGARYSSACSCYGVRSAATITVHPPRTTAYVTVTKTATTTACFLWYENPPCCLKRDTPCDITNPGQCCSATCGVNNRIGPDYYCY
ncbi:hypothetical protein TWF569_007532 [Orbilia oligospora]|uniref:Uncharacterized protein n=1 Tax=Orbilia oligospora TaxID=2813651 RepID=A0A7C8JGK8_ORBOL|nr:hypothetical protein TWF102_007004 [Orbilia oligospora]KAF3114272.1 hypothetical protein TWF706_008208 [Orbilia oligospora]KAF3142677.1 hypothetical protein TWF569_007532 [Orbilia oligospora]